MATAVRKKRGKSSPSTKADPPAASNPLISDAKLKQLYSTMLQCRLLGERSQALRAVKENAEPVFGGEAVAVAAVLDLRRDDWLVPLQQDVLGKFVKGMPLASIFSELRRSGSSRSAIAQQPAASALTAKPSPLNIVPGAANPAAQLNLASGVALALPGQGGTRNVVMAFCGDVSDSGKRWQEALTFAGKHCLPLLVLVHPKAAAKAPSAKNETGFVNLLSDGSLCGLPRIPVDANDVVALYRVAVESIHKARHGGGPTLIHALSVPEFPESKAASGDPPDAIAKMEAYLTAKGLFSESWKQELIDKFKKEIDVAFGSGKNPASKRSRSKKALRPGK